MSIGSGNVKIGTTPIKVIIMWMTNRSIKFGKKSAQLDRLKTSIFLADDCLIVLAAADVGSRESTPLRGYGWVSEGNSLDPNHR